MQTVPERQLQAVPHGQGRPPRLVLAVLQLVLLLSACLAPTTGSELSYSDVPAALAQAAALQQRAAGSLPPLEPQHWRSASTQQAAVTDGLVRADQPQSLGDNNPLATTAPPARRWVAARRLLTDQPVPGTPTSTTNSSSSSSSSSSLQPGAWPGFEGLWSADASDIPYRIIGGVEALRDRFRFICSVKNARQDTHYCGCALIAPNVALTAAHCVAQSDAAMRNPVVEVGRYYRTGQTQGVDYDRFQCTSFVHPAWSFSSAQNDIALCFLSGTSQFQPVALADPGQTLDAGASLTVMGWGATSEGGTNVDVLMMTRVALIARDTCNAAYSNRVGTNQICAGLPAGGADACQGDSGGPLLLEGGGSGADVQVGIVSYGAGCGRAGFPGVYTDVRRYRQWIGESLLARGIAYAPVTNGYTAPATTPAPPPATPAAPTPSPARPSSSRPRPASSTSTTTRPVTASSSSSSRPSSSSVQLTVTAPSSGQTDGAATPTPTAADACACTLTGMSGTTSVPALGCQQHGISYGDEAFFCYTGGGAACSNATASNTYPGAAWRPCEQSVTAMAGVRVPIEALAAAFGNGSAAGQLPAMPGVRAAAGISGGDTQADEMRASYSYQLQQAALSTLGALNRWLAGSPSRP